jgi:ABC-2 type transport system ATP-binding protein
VPTGVVYGFLGPNGAGKTTTMRLLTGLIHPDGGSIELLGRPFGRSDRRRLFDVGALIESPAFYPYLSGRANLRTLAASGAPTPKQRVEEVLELVGLKERDNDKVSTYSLGMKQRLGIAAALLSDPSLLLLDEPANGLDPGGIVGMRDTLRQLAASGKTVFVSSHILPEVQQLADVVGIVAKGKLVREGRVDELLASSAVVRARVGADEAPAAQAAAVARFGAEAVGVTSGGDGTWLQVRTDGSRSAELNQVLAQAGVYASRLEPGSDLESLFLELTGEGSANGGGLGIGGVA